MNKEETEMQGNHSAQNIPPLFHDKPQKMLYTEDEKLNLQILMSSFEIDHFHQCEFPPQDKQSKMLLWLN